MNRETIYTALLNRISTAIGIATDSRRMRLWSDVAPTDKPSLLIRQEGESYDQLRGFPPKITLSAEVYIYFDAGKDPNAIPATTVNTLMDAIDVAMRPDDFLNSVLTLGGLVSHCWIEGDVSFDPGDIDGDGVLVLPVKVLTTT